MQPIWAHVHVQEGTYRETYCSVAVLSIDLATALCMIFGPEVIYQLADVEWWRVKRGRV